MAVRIGDPCGVTDRVARVDRGTGRAALAAGLRIYPIDLFTARTSDAKMPEGPERRIVLVCDLDQHDDEGPGVVGYPGRADTLPRAAVHDGHARVFLVKCNMLASRSRTLSAT